MHIMKNTLNGAKWSENIFSLSTSYNITSDKYKLSEVKFRHVFTGDNRKHFKKQCI